MELNNIWQLLAGLGIFIYGMSLLEDALKQLAGRSFKLFLKKNTGTKFSAILSGTLVTGVLQSSSLVTLMALGFLGAGLMTMRNALAVVFGSNLGTTIDSWLVATIGFEFNIENFSLPVIALASFAMIAFPRRRIVFQLTRFCMGFGLSFLGLGFMKESVDILVTQIDFTTSAGGSIIFFSCIGFIVTAIIQSSSATMVIILTALHSGAVSFEHAVAIITGSELGTSLKIILGSIGGISAKRRVALGNFLFNGVITVIGVVFIHQFISLIYFIIGRNQPLIGLVMFQSMINILGILLFYPFLDRFSDFLNKRYAKEEQRSTVYIQGASQGDATVELFEKETQLLIARVMFLNLEAFHVHSQAYKILQNPIPESANKQLYSYDDKYNNIKKAEGEMLNLYTAVQEQSMPGEDFRRLNQLMEAVRHAMYSLKGIKDVSHDRKEFKNSSNDIKYNQYKQFQRQLEEFYVKIDHILQQDGQDVVYSELSNLMEFVKKEYENGTRTIYTHASGQAVKEIDISTMLNVNREMYSSCKAMIFALKDYLLEVEKAKLFEEIPGIA